MKCKTNDDVKKVGTEWGIMQSKELIKQNVPVLHFYTMGKGEAVRKT
jgi:methylenetetrahydrofolate reductase (NADPH)